MADIPKCSKCDVEPQYYGSLCQHCLEPIPVQSLPPAKVFQPYSAQVTCSPPGSVWSMHGALHQAGITLTPSGGLVGVPAKAGTYELEVRVDDGNRFDPDSGEPVGWSRVLFLTVED